MDWSTPGFLVFHYLPEFAQTHVHKLVMPSNHLVLCHPLLLLPSVFPSIRVFFNCCSVAQLCLTLRPHGLQHARLLCHSPSLRACSNSCPVSRWCHPVISSSVAPFSSCLQWSPANFAWLLFLVWPSHPTLFMETSVPLSTVHLVSAFWKRLSLVR